MSVSSVSLGGGGGVNSSSDDSDDYDRLPDGYSQISRLCVFGPSGFWTMAPLRCAAKFDPFLRPHALHSGAIQGKEGIKLYHLATLLQRRRRRRRRVPAPPLHRGHRHAHDDAAAAAHRRLTDRRRDHRRTGIVAAETARGHPDACGGHTHPRAGRQFIHLDFGQFLPGAKQAGL